MTTSTADDLRFDARLDRELARALPSLPVLDVRDLAGARRARDRLAAAARARWTAPSDVVVEDHTVAADVPVRVRTYQRLSRSSACLVWMHGGGHVMGSLDQDDAFLCELVERTGCTAVSVDWRVSPEAPYPAALDDAYAALCWAHDHAERLGVDPRRVVVGGASSGGGLAAGLVLLARDRGGPDIAAQVLVYPMLDDRSCTASSRAVTSPHLWNRTSNALAWQHYLGRLSGTDEVPPYAAPARATDVRGLPVTWIATGELDLFTDEDVEYARRLLAAGVSTELHVYAGAFHGFDLLVPDAEVSRRYRADRDDALARLLGERPELDARQERADG